MCSLFFPGIFSIFTEKLAIFYFFLSFFSTDNDDDNDFFILLIAHNDVYIFPAERRIKILDEQNFELLEIQRTQFIYTLDKDAPFG